MMTDIPNNLHFVEGDVLDSDQEIVVQQCNCVSTKGHGLSRHIALRFPYADPYVSRRRMQHAMNLAVPEDRPQPGTIAIYGNNDLGQRKIVCAFAQFGMGTSGSYNNADFRLGEDTAAMRHRWFEECLDRVADLAPRSVAFPYKIGCGMAGGDWQGHYLPAIRRFADRLPDMNVFVIRRR
jgi:O-acetyl-ADP-ribose deacetylase (regulator of RNase III)